MHGKDKICFMFVAEQKDMDRWTDWSFHVHQCSRFVFDLGALFWPFIISVGQDF